MATTLVKLIIALFADSTAAEAVTHEEGRLSFDGERIRVGDGATPGGLKALMFGEGGAAPDFDSSTFAATGDESIVFAAAAIHASRVFTVNAGAGAFVTRVIIPATGGGDAIPAGTQLLVQIVFSMSAADYHVDFYSVSTSNPKVMRASSRADGASAAQCTFIYDGSAWVAGPLVYST